MNQIAVFPGRPAGGQQPARAVTPLERIKNLRAEWAALAVLVFTTCVRLRLLQCPLERDEGEYAYSGQLLLQGILPYKLSYSSQKLPGTYGAYAVIMSLFGQSISAIHLGLLLVNLASCVLLFLIVKRLYDPLAGVVACASLAILAMGQSVLGTAAHATHFVMLAALGGFLLLMNAASKPESLFKLYLSGLLLGTAFVMRQPALVFVFFGLLYWLREELRREVFSWPGILRRTAILLFGAACPFAFICIVFAAAGLFHTFWYWTFVYVFQYGSEVPLWLGVKLFLEFMGKVVRENPGIWMIAAAGLLLLFADKKSRGSLFFTTGFLISSLLAVIPGLHFREHYFVQLLPAAGILCGVAVSVARDFLGRFKLSALPRWSPLLLFLAALGVSIFQQRSNFFLLSPTEVCRSTYGPNPFPESIEIAKYLKAHTTQEDRIAVIGSEAQIYFYADRHGATGYIFTYALMEERRAALIMQEQMISEIEAASPKYVVLVNVYKSWLSLPNSCKLIFHWSTQYTRSNYEEVGIADILPSNRTEYRWDGNVPGYTPKSANYITVWKRKS